MYVTNEERQMQRTVCERKLPAKKTSVLLEDWDEVLLQRKWLFVGNQKGAYRRRFLHS